MQEFKITKWSEFEATLYQHVLSPHKRGQKIKATSSPQPLFRGLGNSQWGLQTTLERSHPLECSSEHVSFLKYMRNALASKPIIESLTGKRWEEVPDFGQFSKLFEKHLKQDGWLNTFFNRVPVFEYLTYLRHHGFPSPFLDWTSSPYVAALFAFDAIQKDTEYVAVNALVRDHMQTASSAQHLFVIGPYMRTHPRHHLQQSQYTMCVKLAENDYSFCRHDEAFVGIGAVRAKLIRILISADQRILALKNLDLMNINPFSVYGSEESLMRTIAQRQFLTKDWN